MEKTRLRDSLRVVNIEREQTCVRMTLMRVAPKRVCELSGCQKNLSVCFLDLAVWTNPLWIEQGLSNSFVARI